MINLHQFACTSCVVVLLCIAGQMNAAQPVAVAEAAIVEVVSSS